MTEDERGGRVIPSRRREFRLELAGLINRYGLDERLRTMDWIIADYLDDSLKTLELMLGERDTKQTGILDPLRQLSPELAASRARQYLADSVRDSMIAEDHDHEKAKKGFLVVDLPEQVHREAGAVRGRDLRPGYHHPPEGSIF